MFLNLDKPADDELFASWINDMLELNTAKKDADKKSYLKRMIGTKADRIKYFDRLRYFPDAEDLCASEKRSAIFPKLKDVMEKHTDVYAMLPFMEKEEQIKRTEYCLHGLDNKPGIRIRYLYDQELKVCPECMKEDMEKYGREIIHVPHQLYINTCWKHGCSLMNFSDYSPVKKDAVSKQDMEKAVFAHDLYMTPAIVNFEQTEACIEKKLQDMGLSKEEAFNLCADAGYTKKDVPDTFFKGRIRVQINDEFNDFYIGILTWLFNTAEQFRFALGDWNPAEEYNRDCFELLDINGILGKFKCRSCGHVFYMHPKAAQCGIPCPECIKKMNDEEIYQRYADFLDDGKYNIKIINGKIHMIHEKCGTDRTNNFFSSVAKHSVCPVCREKHERESHIGERIGNMEIIDYKRADDVTVRMDDGTIVEHRNYFYIKQGIETYTREHMGKEFSKQKLKADRVGEKSINSQGVEMTITAYRSCADIDIVFENGETAKNRTYKEFLEGKIRCKSYNKERRIGKTNKNRCGRQMTIIDYRTSEDIDVQFESGEIVTHVTYDRFVRGEIGDPSYASNLALNREQEENVNKNRRKMRIIKYRTSSDIDIQFDTGETVYHTSYAHFKKGDIACPSDKENLIKEKEQETSINNQGVKMRINKYRNNVDIDVEFENGEMAYHKTYANFKNGNIRCPSYYKNFIQQKEQETNVNNQGIKMWIVKYRNNTDVDVQFETGEISCHNSYSNFKRGKIGCPSYKEMVIKNRLQETITNHQGIKMWIKEYRAANDIDVEFETGDIIYHRTYCEFKKGAIRCHKDVPTKD